MYNFKSMHSKLLFTSDINSIVSFFDKYNRKYELAFSVENNSFLLNARSQLFSRLHKKNGKHRYYITTRLYHMPRRFCQLSNEQTQEEIADFVEYTSVYVGRDLETALSAFYASV